MIKKLAAIKLGDHSVKYRVRLEEEVSPYNYQDPKRQLLFLKELADGGIYNGLLACGSSLFERMTIFKDGDRWVAELESIEFEQSD